MTPLGNLFTPRGLTSPHHQCGHKAFNTSAGQKRDILRDHLQNCPLQDMSGENTYYTKKSDTEKTIYLPNPHPRGQEEGQGKWTWATGKGSQGTQVGKRLHFSFQQHLTQFFPMAHAGAGPKDILVVLCPGRQQFPSLCATFSHIILSLLVAKHRHSTVLCISTCPKPPVTTANTKRSFSPESHTPVYMHKDEYLNEGST